MFDFSLSSTGTELGLNRLWAVSQPRLALASLLSPLSSPAQPSHHHSQFSGGRCKILFHLLIPQMRPHSVRIQVCVWSEICDVCSMCVCVCVDGCGVFIFVYSVQLYSRALPIPSVLFWSGNSSVSTSPSSYLLLLTPSYIIAPHFTVNCLLISPSTTCPTALSHVTLLY